MNFARLGLVLVAIGAILLIMFAVTSVNPNVTLADAGLVSALGGGLFVCLGFLQRRRARAEHRNLIIVAGWGITSVGLLVALGAFLLLSQTSCSEACDLTGYYAPIYGGSLAVAAGLTTVIIGKSRRR